MNRKRAWQLSGVVGLGIGLASLTGCQTNVAGMTLPSGHYLQHPPQYFPPSPPFPLQRELAAMEAQTAGQPGVAAAVPVPPPQPAPIVPQLAPGGGLAPAPAPGPNP
jgi:hypothetical protein